MWCCGVASGEVLDCLGWGGRGVEDFGGCWGTAVMGGGDVAGVLFGVDCDVLKIASNFDVLAFD